MVVTVSRGKARRPVRVAILSANPETLDGLQAYLVGAGVPSLCVRTVNDFEKVASDRATAAILFPDDFSHDEVLKLLQHLRSAQPRLLVLIVTRVPQQFGAAIKPDGRSHPPVVLAKPCFGWDILDAIRKESPDSAT